MTRAIPFLTRDHIESEAERLLAGYGERFGLVSAPPVPADEILNTYLKVTLDFDDLPRLLRLDSDVFGATWIELNQVIIDQSLDPFDHPERIGRYNFTVGHETGHWQLHRPYFLKNPNQQLLFQQPDMPTVVCRSSEAKEPIEWQADYFSSCLLMPKQMLREAWHVRYGSQCMRLAGLRERDSYTSRHTESEDLIIERFVKPLASDFAVSATAMRIRAENIGLVVREALPNLFANTANREREFG